MRQWFGDAEIARRSDYVVQPDIHRKAHCSGVDRLCKGLGKCDLAVVLIVEIRRASSL